MLVMPMLCWRRLVGHFYADPGCSDAECFLSLRNGSLSQFLSLLTVNTWSCTLPDIVKGEYILLSDT